MLKIVKEDLDKPILEKSCLSIIVDQNLNSKNDLYNFDKKTFCWIKRELKWFVKIYVYDIEHKSQLDLVAMLLGKNAAKYVKYSYNGMDYGVHDVVTD